MKLNKRKIFYILMIILGVATICISSIKLTKQREEITINYNKECQLVETKYQRTDEIYYYYEDPYYSYFEVKTTKNIDVNNASVKILNTFINREEIKKLTYLGYKNGTSSYLFKVSLFTNDEIKSVHFKDINENELFLTKYLETQELERTVSKNIEISNLNNEKKDAFKKLTIYYILIVVGVIAVILGFALIVFKKELLKIEERKQEQKEIEELKKKSNYCSYCGAIKNTTQTKCDNCGANYEIN